MTGPLSIGVIPTDSVTDEDTQAFIQSLTHAPYMERAVAYLLAMYVPEKALHITGEEYERCMQYGEGKNLSLHAHVNDDNSYSVELVTLGAEPHPHSVD